MSLVSVKTLSGTNFISLDVLVDRLKFLCNFSGCKELHIKNYFRIQISDTPVSNPKILLFCNRNSLDKQLKLVSNLEQSKLNLICRVDINLYVFFLLTIHYLNITFKP